MLDLSKYDGAVPGPWSVRGQQATGTMCVVDRDSAYVVDRFVLGSRPKEEHAANARLIADAPTLLREVRGLRAECEHLYNTIQLMRSVPGSWEAWWVWEEEVRVALEFVDKLAGVTG